MQLSEQRRSNVMLSAENINPHRSGNGSSRKNKRYLIARNAEIIEMLLVSSHVVRHDDNKRIVPSRQSAILSQEIPHHAVRIGKSIQPFVLQALIRHIKRLMTRRSLEHPEPRAALARPQISEQPFSNNMVGHPPLAQFVLHREISIRDDVLITLRNKVRTLMGEIHITTVIIRTAVAA